MGTTIVDDAINLVHGQSIDPKTLNPGSLIGKDNVNGYLPRAKVERKQGGLRGLRFRVVS